MIRSLLNPYSLYGYEKVEDEEDEKVEDEEDEKDVDN